MLAAQKNPVSALAALPQLPSLENPGYRQRIRLALEGALRSLPQSRRRREVLRALRVATVSTSKALLRLAASDGDPAFLRQACAAAWAGGLAHPTRRAVHRDVRVTMLLLLSKLGGTSSGGGEEEAPSALFELGDEPSEDDEYVAKQVCNSLNYKCP